MNYVPIHIRRKTNQGAAIFRRAFSRRRCEYSREIFGANCGATNRQILSAGHSRRAFFPVAACAAALLSSGCNRAAPPTEIGAATPQNSSAPRASTARETASTRNASAPVFINIAKLAQRHPAWILANQLERSDSTAPSSNASTREAREINVARPLTPRRANDVAIPAVPVLRNVALPRHNITVSGDNSFSASAVSADARRASTRSGEDSLLPPPARTDSAPQFSGAPTFSRDFGTFLDAMANRQSVALARFFSVTQQRGAARRDQLRSNLLNALDDDIAADTEFQELQNTVPPAFLPPPATQLEMTNLRLQLVENARTSPVERDAATARLEELEAAWRHRAENSLNAWLTARETVLTERPRQLKIDGTQRIAQTLGALQSSASTRSEALRATQLELLARDFGAQPNFFTPDDFVARYAAPVFPDFHFAARSNDFSAQSQRAPSKTTSREKNTVRYETSRVLSASANTQRGASFAVQRHTFPDIAPPRSVRVLASPQRRAQIVALRARALRETTSWARMAARRGGWKNVSYLSMAGEAPQKGTRDVTVKVARILQLP